MATMSHAIAAQPPNKKTVLWLPFSSKKPPEMPPTKIPMNCQVLKMPIAVPLVLTPEYLATRDGCIASRKLKLIKKARKLAMSKKLVSSPNAIPS